MYFVVVYPLHHELPRTGLSPSPLKNKRIIIVTTKEWLSFFVFNIKVVFDFIKPPLTGKLVFRHYFAMQNSVYFFFCSLKRVSEEIGNLPSIRTQVIYRHLVAVRNCYYLFVPRYPIQTDITSIQGGPSH